MNIQCDDDRYELIKKYKNRLIEYTNIEHSEEEMKVLDDILFRLWQLDYLRALDKYEKIRRQYWQWKEKIQDVWGADEDTMLFIREISKEVEE